MAPVYDVKIFGHQQDIETTTLNTGAKSIVTSQLVLCPSTLEITCALLPLRSHTCTCLRQQSIHMGSRIINSAAPRKTVAYRRRHSIVLFYDTIQYHEETLRRASSTHHQNWDPLLFFL